MLVVVILYEVDKFILILDDYASLQCIWIGR
jgi:hypothetical protein